MKKMYDELMELKAFMAEADELVIFGAGDAGRKVYELVRLCGNDISMFIDNDEKKQGTTFCDRRVEGVQSLQEGMSVILASIYHKEIHRQLKELKAANRCFDAFNFIGEESESITIKSFYKKGMENKFCTVPFTTLHIYSFYATQCCPAFISNVNIGSLQDSSIDEIWNSPMAQQVRASVLDGSFCYCDFDVCYYSNPEYSYLKSRDDIEDEYWQDIINKRKTVMDRGPREIGIGIDPSCNLACTMCRSEKIDCYDDNTIRSLTDKILNHYWDSVEYITLASTGEVFYSPNYLKILSGITEENFPKLKKIMLFTNGVLFTEDKWEKYIGGGYLQNIDKEVIISVDAYTEDTYNKIRRHGYFPAVKKNLEWISQYRKDGRISSLQLNFCVQEINYREMADFAYWCRELGVDSCVFQLLRNMPVKDSIHDISHPEHQEFLKVMENPIFNEPWVEISQIRNELDK